MAENPLIGKTISLISKKNIRYLGTLYSINEQNATVALQNVKSYGTEGREEDGRAVAPSDAVHPFLLFRGQDIKDLHVHEASAEGDGEKPGATGTAAQGEEKSEEAVTSTSGETQQTAPKTNEVPEKGSKPTAAPKQSAPNPPEPPRTAAQVVAGTSGSEARTASTQSAGARPSREGQQQGGRGRGRGRGNRKPQAAPGTGASLLNRTARGTNSSEDTTNFKQDFDFQSNLDEFQKENTENPVAEPDDGGDVPVDDDDDDDDADVSAAYDKDDFFDSISSDATDRANGIDNRLRGRQERSLNTETFGAVALNQDNYRRRGGRGRGRGGRGRGRGRGGRGYRGGRGRGRGSYRGGRGSGTSSFNANGSGTTAAASS